MTSWLRLLWLLWLECWATDEAISYPETMRRIVQADVIKPLKRVK